jgi:putative ABC transport system permease protein
MSLRDLRQDAVYALRAMKRAPGFTAVAVLTLAAAIGVNTAMFSVVDAVLLRPLPYAHAAQLHALWNYWPGTERGGLSDPELLDFRERARTFDVAAFAGGTDNLTGRGQPEQLVFTAVTANWLDVLGVQPALGRSFRAEEELAGGDDVVILTDGLWRRLFDGDPAALGQRIILDGRPHTVIGVLGPGFARPGEFESPERSAYLRPLALDSAAPRNERGSHYMAAIVQPRPGYTAAQAGGEVQMLARRFVEEYKGEYDEGYGARLVPLQSEIVGNASTALYVLLGAVGLVLLIASANVANLLLARAKGRQREMAIRRAVGATRGRLARQLLTEAVVLSGISAVVGLLLAHWLIATAIVTAPGIPRLDEATLDPRVLAFTAGVAAITALVFGIAPALHIGRDAQAARLSERRATSSLSAGLRAALVGVQVGVAVILLIGASLLLQSFSRLLRVPSGFNAERVLTFDLAVPLDGYSERSQVVRFFDAMFERIRSSSGVVAAGAVAGLPLRSQRGDWDVYLEGETPGPGGSDRPTDWQVVTPGYFETMGIRVVGGRPPARTDTADAPAVAVINETFARTYFPGIDSVGRQVRMSGNDRPWMTVVGVVGDVHQDSLDAAPPPEIYMPHAQFTPFWQDSTLRTFTVVVRSTVDPTALVATVRQHVRELDPNLPIATIATMEDVVRGSVAQRRFLLGLLSGFAAIALVFAVLGAYGVLAYQINERMREFGIRLALGATARDIAGVVLRQGMPPALAGVAAGLAGAALLTRVMTGLLFEITPLDPATFAGVAAVLLVAALAACTVPARRAIHADPGAVLKAE